MNIDDIIFAQPIGATWQQLGGDPPRRGRARAFYREGGNPGAVSLNDEKACWHDFVTGEGGGVLDLVQRIRGCNRADALRWLSETVGIPLEARPVGERRAYAVRGARAELEASQLARDAADWERGLELFLIGRVEAAAGITAGLLSRGIDAGDLLVNARHELVNLGQMDADVLVQTYRKLPEAQRRLFREEGRHDREHAEQITRAIVGILAEADSIRSDRVWE